jgi:hypothetical protein
MAYDRRRQDDRIAAQRLTAMAPFPHLAGFVLIVGNARSGSTLMGAVLDGHPGMVIANETSASATFWRGLDGEAILREVWDNAERNAAQGRPSEGYSYQIGPPPSQKREVVVAGDKVFNPATLLLHGDHGLIPSLEDRLGVPVRLIYAIRNPFDTIATMHRRSGATLADRTRWYFMHCDAAEALRARLPADRFLESHHDDLLGSPDDELARLCGFLGVRVDDDHRHAVRRALFSSPRRTRSEAAWTAAHVGAVQAGIGRFPCLARYAGSAADLVRGGGS